MTDGDEQHYLLLYCAYICILETTFFAWRYPCERMEGIVCMYITLEELYSITMHLDFIVTEDFYKLSD